MPSRTARKTLIAIAIDLGLEVKDVQASLTHHDRTLLEALLIASTVFHPSLAEYSAKLGAFRRQDSCATAVRCQMVTLMNI
eukprot:6194188-Pleurochrysis_carterae.AAC.3